MLMISLVSEVVTIITLYGVSSVTGLSSWKDQQKLKFELALNSTLCCVRNDDLSCSSNGKGEENFSFDSC